jgi:hypothetical protein
VNISQALDHLRRCCSISDTSTISAPLSRSVSPTIGLFKVKHEPLVSLSLAITLTVSGFPVVGFAVIVRILGVVIVPPFGVVLRTKLSMTLDPIV